jgi:hypothetical protein
MADITQAHIKAITRNLRASYGPDITEEYITTEVDAIRAGTEPTDIIGMFVKSMLENAGLL